MPADPTILERIRGCPFARDGRVLVRFRANGYSLVAQRSGVPLAGLRLTGEGDDVVLLHPSHRGWEPPAAWCTDQGRGRINPVPVRGQAMRT